jgi:hypothetical protein
MPDRVQAIDSPSASDATPGRDRRRALTITLALLIAVRLLSAIFVFHFFVDNGRDPRKQLLSADIVRYQQIAQAKGRAYRDFDVEYPPVDLLVIRAVADAPVNAAAARLGWLMFLSDLGVGAALWYGWGRAGAIRYLILGLPLLSFIYFRVDLFTLALAVGALALLRRDHEGLAGLALALAVLSKVWPALLLPAMLIQRKTRAVLSFAITLGIGTALWLAWGGLDGLRQVLGLRHTAGWHTESTVGSVMWAFTNTRVVFEGRGLPRVGVAPFWAKGLLLAAGLSIGLLGWWWVRKHGSNGIARGALVAVAGLLVTSPFLAIQYLSWLLPWGSADDEEGGDQLRVILFAIMLATTLLFLRFNGEISFHLFWITTGVLLVRNALLALLLIAAASRLRQQRRAAEGSQLSSRTMPDPS